jgi:hypothetical protein
MLNAAPRVHSIWANSFNWMEPDGFVGAFAAIAWSTKTVGNALSFNFSDHDFINRWWIAMIAKKLNIDRQEGIVNTIQHRMQTRTRKTWAYLQIPSYYSIKSAPLINSGSLNG